MCAALPGGDPNHVTDDFAAHLTLEHRAPSRDILISFTFLITWFRQSFLYRCIRAFKTNVSRYVSMVITATCLHVHKHYFFQKHGIICFCFLKNHGSSSEAW